MEYFIESTDLSKTRLSIFESFENNQITEDEKNALLEAVLQREIKDALIEEASMDQMASMAKVAAIAAGAVAASTAIIGLVVKVASMLKVKDKIKASSELTNISNDIKKCNTQLKHARAELNSIINEYRVDIYDAENRASFYGSRVTVTNYSTVDYQGNVNYGHQYANNPQYDKDKAEREKKKADKIRKTVNKYIAKRDELQKELKHLKELKSKFMAVVRNNTTAEECESIRAELDKIMASIPNS